MPQAATDLAPGTPAGAVLAGAALIADHLTDRLERLPDQLRGPMLELLGLRPDPPWAARTMLSFWTETPVATLRVVPKGTAVGDADGSVVFSTAQDLRLVPVTVVAVLSEGRQTMVDFTDDWARETPMAAFGPDCEPGDAFLLGLDAPAPGCTVELTLELTVLGVGVDPRDPPIVWECWNAVEGGWTPCPVLTDTTGGLCAPGTVGLQLPPEHGRASMAGTEAAWVRCRLMEALPEQPTYSSPPVISQVSVATVGGTTEAWHGRLVTDEPLGESTGEPGQRFVLRHAPIATAGTPPIVEVRVDGGWQAWTLVDRFTGSDPGDRHVLLDAATGEVLCGPAVADGDGSSRQYGAVPPVGALLRIRDYWTGGGRVGNLPADTLDTILDDLPGLTVSHRATTGGRDGESADDLWHRAPAALQSRDRAVTAEDYEHLARRADPTITRIRCVSTDDGTIQVLVVPTIDATDARSLTFPALRPPSNMLDRVARYLDERRIIGTRFTVEPPYYQGVTVVASVVAEPRRRLAAVREAVLDALYEYLHPITGGPTGTGWPFGRPVRIGELHAVIHAVPGVGDIDDLRLHPADPVTGERGEAAHTLVLGPNTLAYSYQHLVKVTAR
ncbi:putative baseplate assembly protein [Longispora fulva]|nr:putative baseplate assembly protein [Longispora fulva]